MTHRSKHNLQHHIFESIVMFQRLEKQIDHLKAERPISKVEVANGF